MHMTEPEVSIYIALHHMKNGLTQENVTVSIDGAHVKTGNDIHFDIKTFLKKIGLVKIDGNSGKWQGEYELSVDLPKLIISSKPGVGDVVIHLKDGSTLFVEGKKGKNNKNSSEYSLMREAIGQLMTNPYMNESVIPAVAVPFSNKSEELALRWAALPQIKQVGIRFILVKENGDLLYY